jgi:transposase-like protein
MSTRKKYDPKLKTKIVLELLKEEKTVSQLASEHGIHHSVLIRWRDQAVNGLPELLSDQNKVLVKVRAEYETKIESLYSEVGRLTSDLSWLKKKSGILIP